MLTAFLCNRIQFHDLLTCPRGAREDRRRRVVLILLITTISLMIYTKSEPFYDFGLLKDTREDRGAAYDYIKAWST